MAPADATLSALSAPLVSSPDETHTIDQVLEKWAGQFGPAQQLHFTLSSLAWALHALLTLAMVFADSTPQWACITSTTTPYPSHGGSSVEVMDTSERHIIFNNSSSSCNISSSICAMDASAWMWVGGTSQSTVSEWGLVCGKEYMISLVQSVYFLGALLGAGVYGSLSDSFLGRKGVLILTCCLSPICSLLTAFSPNYWTYFLLRSATGFNCGGMGLSCFVLATENIGPAKRGPVAMSAFYFFSGGILMLSAFAYFMRSWRHLYLLISIPCFLYCILALPFLTESPRWYLSRGRADDAMAIMNQIAKRNGRSIPAGIKLDKEQEDSSNQTIAEQWNIQGSARSQDHDYDPPESICVVTDCLNNTGKNNHVQIRCPLRNPSNQAHDPQSQNDHLDLQTLAQLQAPEPENSTLCCMESAGNAPSHYIPPFNDQPHPISQNAQNQTAHQNIRTEEQIEHLPISKMQSAQNQIAHQNIRTEEQIQQLPISKTHPPASNATIFDIFRNPITRTRMLIMMCIWLDVQITYYGINLSASRIGSNLYLNIVLNATAELPALAISAILLKPVGRKAMLVSVMLMTGTACTAGALMWDTGANGRLACGLVGIFGVAVAYNLIYIYTAELFPSEVRNAAMGVASQAAQVGAIMSPATALLGEVQPWLPFGLLGGVSLMGAVLALQLPETRNAPMYETLHGMEKAQLA